ncbi:aminotransferase class IV [Frigoribacterium salinisoli]
MPDEGGAVGSVLVADSWLVDDGLVRALDVHRDRFAGSVADAVPALTAEVAGFWSAVVAALPREGAWFPRVELVERVPTDHEHDHDRENDHDHDHGRRHDRADEGTGLLLRLHLRPAPERRRDVVLATAPTDPRTAPLVKGPDLAALGALREAVAPSGAEEAVLLAPDGTIVEGAWSSLVWWEGDALCLPPADVARLPGVTLRTVLALAAALGVDVLHERRRPDELDGLEVWSLSALHGVRIATRWVDGPALAEQPGRLRSWRARLDALRRPL